jgi:hypothetical protein
MQQPAMARAAPLAAGLVVLIAGFSAVHSLESCVISHAAGLRQSCDRAVAATMTPQHGATACASVFTAPNAVPV